ncbi:MAG TPA: lamin tail domain-containing protein [Verrucomicrobiales bacterium]|nr:lamin tail domain-containing protein [Verrucomicrobiales bacterium]
MKRLFTLAVCLLASTCFCRVIHAAPVTIPNFSMETPVVGVGGWSNALTNWTGTAGANSGQAFTEGISGFFSQGTQHLGMELNYDVWQDLPTLYEAASEYTLTIAAGNRTNLTQAGNDSQYAFAQGGNGTVQSLYGPNGTKNASTFAAGTFGDAPPLTMNTNTYPAAVGKSIRILLRARGTGGRSHFDNIRLTKTSPGAVTHGAPVIQSSTTTIPVVITSTGDSANFSATLHWGTSDGGTTAASWGNSVALGTALANGATVNGVMAPLTPGVTYYYRAKGTNFAGDTWATATGSFVPPVPSLPVIQNDPATLIGTHSAQLNGQVTNTGGDAPTIITYWGTVDGGTNAAAWQSSANLGVKPAAFSNTPTGLPHSTTYYYRSYATNASGSVWAPASQSFTTTAVTAPALLLVPAIGETAGTALLNGTVTNLGNEAPSITFYWGTANGGTNPAAWANSFALTTPQSSAFGHLAANLAPNTTYYWTVRATNSGGTSWANPVQSFVTNAKPPVFINEVHYDPDDHTKRIEFIELWNPSTTPVNISGWMITGSADYVFPANTTIGANSYLVVAENPAQLNTAYNVPNALGPWSGVLGNGSGNVVLRNAATTQIDDVDYQQGFPWPTRAAGGGSSIELINPGLENDIGGSWRSSIPVSPSTQPLPTPGRINSNYATVAPPAISNVSYAAVVTPAQEDTVKSGQDVKVTAQVDDRNGVGSVTLEYQIVDPGSYIPLRLQTTATLTPPLNPAYQNGWVPLPMRDDGTGGDAFSGDRTYTVTVPGSLAVHRRLMRYRIIVTDTLGSSVQVPYSDDESPNFAWFVYNGAPAWSGAMRPTTFAGFPATAIQNFSAELVNSIEPWQLITLDADVNNCQYNNAYNDRPFSGTFVYKGKVYDHVFYKVRGIGSTYNTGKNKWAIKFNRARDFQAYDNWGRPFKETWNSVGMDADACPWASVHRGAAGVEEAVSYRAFELAGNPSLKTTNVHFRIIRRPAEVNTAGVNVSDPTMGGTINGQYSGDLMGLYLALEPTEGNFIGERNLPDGNIYAIEGNNGDQKYQAANQPSGGTDWITFRNGLAAGGQTETWYRDNMDLKTLFTFMAVSRLIGNVDVRPGDNYRFYHRSSDNRWQIMAYDLDMMFIAASHWGGTMDGVVVAGAPNAVLAMMRWPNIAQEYRNRCREVLGLFASDAGNSGGQIGQLLDEYSQMVNPAGVALTWSDLDANLWNLHPRTAGGGANTGQNSPKGNFFRALYNDGGRGGLGGTIATGTWIRQLSDPDADNFSDHEGLIQWFKNFTTNTYPAAIWTRKATSGGPNSGGTGNDPDVNRQKGYGWKYLEWETLYGGYFNANINPAAGIAIGDLDAAGATLFPVKPTITYTGSAGYPVNDVRLHTSDYNDPQGPNTITAVQWRVGEISAPGIPLYDAAQPRIYEIEDLWTSTEIATASPVAIPDVRVPTSVLRAGHTYRARVRHKDNTGRWSYWSEPLQFITGTPDVSAYAAALRVTEVNYNPGPITAAEAASPGWNPLWDEQDMEFIELRNISGSAIDLTDVRFTKGINFDFMPATLLPAGANAVLVKNPAAFAVRYPGVTPAGTYGADNLANGGEEVKLSYGAGASIISFTYDDAEPWPVSPDGSGPTLVLKTPNKTGLDHNLASEWRASYQPNGNPGSNDGSGTTYDTWAAGYPGIGNRDADDDRDGYNNRLEYALAGNPQSPVSPASPTASFTQNGGQTYATLTYIRRTDADDATYSVEFGTDLTGWAISAELVSSTSNGNNTLTEVWRSTSPVSIRARVFGRVLVTTIP